MFAKPPVLMVAAAFRFIAACLILLACSATPAQSTNISQVPLFVTQAVTPQVMLTMSNDHQLYFEAYPDYADLTGDGAAERTYNHTIVYYGYFDSYKCYDYDTSDELFVPESITEDKYCSGNWSGNFLNYISMARIDVIRKILYGGYRSEDTNNLTVLERTYLPNDAHSWVRYYDGNDIDKLTPFSLPSATTATSSTSNSVPAGSRNESAHRKTFTTGWNSTSQAQIGDQVVIRDQASPNTIWMMGVIRTFNASNGEVNIQVTSSSGADATLRNNWSIANNSRQGISFCNTTFASNGTFSQNVTTPPLIRIASGNYSLWTANERHQCRWYEELNRMTGHDQMRIGELNFSNGNDFSATGIPANSDNPVRLQVGLGQHNYNVRVQACVAGLVGTERCKEYPDGNLKPIGLLQHHGDNETLHFGLLTGSYMKNKSGGVLRKNIGSIADEINISTDGTFKTIPADGGIIGTLDRFRIYGYRHHTGTGNTDATYNSSAAEGDNCPWGLSSFNDGRCTNWGNPQSEMFIESLRYFAGKSPATDFVVSGTDRITGLPALTSWQDPLSNDNWCAPLSIINFNSSVSSYDADQLGGVTDIGGSSASALTSIVGEGEGIHGQSWFVGESGALINQLCTSKTVNSLGEVLGICPDAPRLQGSYHIAGLAHYAYTESLRNDLKDSQNNTVDIQAKTYGVSLAPAVPRIEIPKPGEKTPAVTILPACRNTSVGGNCAIVDFKVIDQNIDAGTGAFLVQWEDSEQGGDYDMDLNGVINYVISDSTITVTTNVFSQSSPNDLIGFGYVISGTTQDGFHVHSGINGFNHTSGTSVPGCSNCRYDNAPTSHTFTLGGSSADSLREPLYYAAKWGGFDKEMDFPSDPKSWDSSGDGMPDNYYYAINPAKLAADLEKVFKDVVETTGSAASVVANSVRLDTGTYIYQARFRTNDWSGELIAYPVLMDGSLGEMDWEAGTKLPTHSDRNIFTYNPEATPKGVVFTWDNLNADQKTALGDNEAEGQAVLSYIRGNQDNELQKGGSFRNRERLLGDIINSDPVFVSAANYGYNVSSIPEGFTVSEEVEGAYNQFLAANASREKMIYLGANDGMLHGFRADDGVELFAFIPNAVIPNLKELTNPGYSHRYYVDGPPRVGDAYINGQWRTILVGSTGAGGRSVFALDITDPDNFSAANVLWEFTHPDLGYSIGQPTIARLDTGDWVAIFGNGYGSSNHRAKLFILNLATGGKPGSIIDQNPIILDTKVGAEGSQNGLSTPIPVDINNDRITDFVYAGDLHGNLWKIDLRDKLIAKWDFAFIEKISGVDYPRPLFTARDKGNNVQPITARPVVGSHPDGGYMVYFGTGKFFEVGDNNVDNISEHQTFYGIRDTGTRITVTDRSVLKEQEILYEGVQFDVPVRVTSKYQLNYTDTSDPVNNPVKRGWFLDLIKPDGQDGVLQGERVISTALLRSGKIIFSTLIPSDHLCDFGGSSWLMELDAISGGRLDYSPFDFNGDLLFNVEDFVTVTIVNEDGEEETVTVPVSGLKLDVGIAKTPAVISAGEVEYKFFSGSSGDIQVISENPGDAAATGRQSWRQLQ
ncbi:type IV pilus assembly protein PilY1 [Desulfonatronum zhilinae]|nr:type IV pilus assembly protein PilY1 [Desulfonatronum zhilinae]